MEKRIGSSFQLSFPDIIDITINLLSENTKKLLLFFIFFSSLLLLPSSSFFFSGRKKEEKIIILSLRFNAMMKICFRHNP